MRIPRTLLAVLGNHRPDFQIQFCDTCRGTLGTSFTVGCAPSSTKDEQLALNMRVAFSFSDPDDPCAEFAQSDSEVGEITVRSGDDEAHCSL